MKKWRFETVIVRWTERAFFVEYKMIFLVADNNDAITARLLNFRFLLCVEIKLAYWFACSEIYWSGKEQERTQILKLILINMTDSTLRELNYANEPRAKHTKKNIARKQTIQRYLIDNMVKGKHLRIGPE